MSGSVPVIESAHVERPTKPRKGDGTFAERVLADTIDKHPGPIVREEDKFDGEGDEHAQAVAQAHVYRMLTDRSYLKLELHLKSAHYVRETLGLKDVPDDTTFSNSWREQFTDGTKAFLKEYCSWIQDELEKLGIREVEPYLPDEKREYASRESITDGQKRRCVRNVWGLIEDDFDFDRGPGIEWSTQYLYDVFAEGASKGITPYEVLDKERKDTEDASLKAVMNAADQRTADEWIEVFDRLFQRLFDRLHALGWFTRPVDAYVDGTTRPMWPSGELPEGVKGADVKESTNYAWQYATLVVEERGIQVPVAVVPITDEIRPEDQLEKLLEQAEGRVTIDVLQADGAYAGARPQKVLKDSPIVSDYILRGTRRSDEVKRRLVTMTGKFDDGGEYVTTSQDNQVRSASRLVADPDWNHATMEYLNTVPDSAQHGLGAFGGGGANEAVDLDDVDDKLWKSRRPYYTSLTEEQASAEEVAEMYDDRWIVEDNYANTKRNQLGKTDSPNHAIQTFVFCLGMLFSVAWAACRVFLREDHPEAVPNDRPIISAREIVVFVRLEYG